MPQNGVEAGRSSGRMDRTEAPMPRNRDIGRGTYQDEYSAIGGRRQSENWPRNRDFGIYENEYSSAGDCRQNWRSETQMSYDGRNRRERADTRRSWGNSNPRQREDSPQGRFNGQGGDYSRSWGTTHPDLERVDREGNPAYLEGDGGGQYPVVRPGIARKSIVPIETFSGKNSEDISDFKENFLRAADINGWTGSLTAKILPSYLGGRAKDFYTNLAPGSRSSVEKTFRAMDCHFNSSAIRYQTRNTLAERGQKTNESVADFYQNISGLVRKAWGDLPRECQRQRLLEYFIRGLRQSIRKVFFDDEPSSIEEALRKAEGREIYLKGKQKGMNVAQIGAGKGSNAAEGGSREANRQGTVRMPSTDRVPPTDRVTSTSEIEALKTREADLSATNLVLQAQGPQTELERLRKKVAELTATNQTLMAQRSLNDPRSKADGGIATPTRPPGSPAAPRNNVSFRDAPACWGCGARTHFRANCPNRGNEAGNRDNRGNWDNRWNGREGDRTNK